MYKNNRLQEKYLKLQRSKKTSQEPEEIQTKVVTNVQVDKANNDVQNNCEQRISGHSTPVRNKVYASNVEDSPEIDYLCSPVQCTQDGGNDVAWDWQNIKLSNDKSKINCGVETPKRTKQLQKKRNSNSPLLYKPVKRKLAKVERMESIGKFTAELKALTERMNDIHRNDDSQSEDELAGRESTKSDNISEFDQENHEINIQDIPDKENNLESSSACKANSTYADLFDDTADDFMIRCSQEVEAKFLDCVEKNNLTEKVTKSESEQPSVNSKSIPVKVEVKSVDQTVNNKSDISKQSDFKTLTKTNVQSKSKNSTIVKEKVTQSCKSKISNLNCEKTLSTDIWDSFDFADDSFDDCLASCVDDENLISQLNEYDNVFSDEGHQVKNPSGDSNEDVNLNSLKNKTENKFIPKTSMASLKFQGTTMRECQIPEIMVNKKSNSSQAGYTQSKNVVADHMSTKKFFKTKSLSASSFEQPENKAMNSETKIAARANLLVGTNFSSTNKKCVSDNNISALSANRFAQKEGGKFIVRHHSDTSFNNNAKEAYTSSQCTPEEIEKKRLEAKMRLEAKRKQLLNSNRNCVVKDPPVLRPVKR